MKVLPLKLSNYFPLGYVFQSRIITKAERISWFLIFPLFLFIPIIFNDADYLSYLLVFLSLLSSYEIGYLYNDVITTRKEISPTIRHSGFQEHNFFYCVFIRVVFCTLISGYFYFSGYENISFYLIASFVIVNFLFFCHNTVRSKFNIITYLFLVTSRYIVPVGLFCSYSQMFVIFLIFPVCRTIEHACKKKYGLIKVQNIVGNPDVFRVKYLFIVFIITLFVVDDLTSIAMVSYFFILRILSLLVAKMRFFRRNRHSSY